ncbi:hypothetical protein ABH931_007271 [Streptacidiphilus sp. MAP12-33]|uniref:hypothetical protein n=1 Tax=Streptacidiphilus sp. MAP12-33 TaxID=3156266 RepID=UPI003512BC35
MQRMIDVSDEVRAEIGDDEADRLLGGGTAPDRYDCTSCRAPGDVTQEPTATVLFVGEETAVLAFAHARCIPSQVVEVSEEQLQGAVRTISASMTPGVAAPVAPAPELHVPDSVPSPAGGQVAPAVLGVTCGLVLCQGVPRAALVVEPTGPVGRPGTSVGEDTFVELLLEHGFQPIVEVEQPPAQLRGWSVLMAMGQLHAVLQPVPGGGTNAWWQAHAPLQVTDAWRSAASQQAEVIMYAAPHGSVGRQPREDLLRHALDNASRKGLLLGATLPLAGT